MFRTIMSAGAVLALWVGLVDGAARAAGGAEARRVSTGEITVGGRRAATRLESRRLAARFRAIGYDLAKVRALEAPVPRIYLSAFPGDLARLRSVGARKSLFIQTVLPLILVANEAIAGDRHFLLDLRTKRRRGEGPTVVEERRLEALALGYGGDSLDLETLLRRVDTVPPSLALAQAAEESGWGTSRFARKGNAVFGQRTWNLGRGMVPLARERGERHEVVSFNALRASVEAYVRNLNTHPAYAAFRRVRAEARALARPLPPSALVGTMTRYSERGPDYIQTILAIIRVNRLTTYDPARLASKPGVGI